MFRNLLERARNTPAWIWITIAIAAASLVVSFLIYRNGQNTPTSQSGNTPQGGLNPGDVSGGYSPYGNTSSQYQPPYSTDSLLQQILNTLQGQRPTAGTPDTPGTPGSGGPVLVAPGPGGVTYGTKVPTTPPHPVSRGPVSVSPGSVTSPQSVPSVHGSVVHSDTATGSVPHQGAVAVNAPHPLLLRQQPDLTVPSRQPAPAPTKLPVRQQGF